MKAHTPFDQPTMSEIMLQNAVVRAKQEHELLKEELQDIFGQVCSIRSNKDELRVNREIGQLNDSVKHFMKHWGAHTSWEDRELFPYACWYLGTEPDSFALMEQEYELAEQYIRSFLYELERSLIPIPREEARRMSSYLIQAYAVLKNRFLEEEEIMEELTDRSNRYDF